VLEEGTGEVRRGPKGAGYGGAAELTEGAGGGGGEWRGGVKMVQRQ
jgi:hypothetical protein